MTYMSDKYGLYTKQEAKADRAFQNDRMIVESET